MTLVCATHHGNVPILLSDVLLSSKGRASHAEVATYDDLGQLQYTDPSYKISGTACKLVIMRPRLAVGWVGSQVEAYSLIRFVHDRIEERPSLDRLRSLLIEYFQAGAGNVILVGSLVWQESATFFRWDSANGQFLTGPFFAEGSGARSFHASFAPERDPKILTTSGFDEPVLAAAGWGIRQIARLLAGEILNGENLAEHFGGGFDLVIFDGNSFCRVAALTQIFMKANLVSLSPLKVGFKFLASSIWQSVENSLIVERVDVALTGKMTPRIITARILKNKRSEATFFRAAEYGKGNPEEPKFLAVHCQLRVADGSFGLYSSTYGIPNTEIRVERSSTKLRLRFSEDFYAEIVKGIDKILLQYPEVRATVQKALLLSQ